MKRFFSILCFVLLVAVGESWAQTSANEPIDALFEELSQIEGADGLRIGPFMMKMVRTFAKQDKEVTEEQRQFFKAIKSILIVDMSECSAASQAAFKKRMQELKLQGFTKIENPDGVQAITFYNLVNGRVNMIVTGLFEPEAYSFTVFEGNFDEAFAKEFNSAEGNSPIRKAESPKK